MPVEQEAHTLFRRFVLTNKKEETALAVWKEKYPALTTDVGALLRESLGDGARLTMADLPTVKVPAGGATSWQLPTGESAEVLEGVLVVYQPVRAFWEESFEEGGGGSPPDCSSDDTVIGKGMFGVDSETNPTGQCDKCPMSEFGSGKNNAQACRLVTRLFLLQEGSLVPTLVLLPPSSYKEARAYVRDIAVIWQTLPTRMLTKIELVKDKSGGGRDSKGGITYSKAFFAKPEPLPADVAMYMLAYRQQMEKLLKATAISEGAEPLDVEHERVEV